MALKVALVFLILGIVGGVVYFTPGKAPPPPPTVSPGNANILFVGDMFFDRYIRRVSESVGGDFIFSCIYPFLADSGFIVGNLEGPITENASVSVGTTPGDPLNFKFTFPTETAKLLKRNGVSAVSLGNNHSTNFGLSGLASTTKYLDEAGVGYFGGLSGDEPIYRAEIDGVPVSLVAFNEFGGDTPEHVSNTIRDEREHGRSVIVYAHWGDEYSTSTTRIRPIAELFAQNGARAVIGSHPHIVLPSEYIGNTLVYYSLGNFIFDQYWEPAVTRGLAILIHIPAELSGTVSVTEYPVITQTDGRTCLAEATPR